ncbi:hypothetical protein NE237_016678 [Protea cynaroides]|uniref:Uncharacterized protein n=1 Tax=Protea cynaroides TaxID=273540 RepID=A0A9Q0HF91_9MAGN|nr:hypothetical protein NE237_016678 [Protea cynaroides]
METEKWQFLDFSLFHLEDWVCFLCKFFFHERSQYNRRRRSCGATVAKKKKGGKDKPRELGLAVGILLALRNLLIPWHGRLPHMSSQQDRRKVSDRSISCLGLNQLGFSLRGVSSTSILWNSSITEIELQKQ